MILDDILDGKNLLLKKEIIKRNVLGTKIDNIGSLDIY